MSFNICKMFTTNVSLKRLFSISLDSIRINMMFKKMLGESIIQIKVENKALQYRNFPNIKLEESYSFELIQYNQKLKMLLLLHEKELLSVCLRCVREFNRDFKEPIDPSFAKEFKVYSVTERLNNKEK